MGASTDVAPAYDAVAELYDRAFSDIRVRRAELRWLKRHLRAHPRPRVLEIGCGSGALLRALSTQITTGTGVDISPGMIAQAQARADGTPNLTFMATSDATLPFADRSFDLVISFLSFRYLDWPKVMPEIRRVLSQGGRFLMVDLVAERVKPWEGVPLMGAALRQLLLPVLRPAFARDLKALTTHPDWQAMLARHPIRTLSEYRTYFAQACPSRKLHTLDVALSRRIVALDSGPLNP